MRITGGKAKGIILNVPKSNKTRPATDALRQAIFSSIGNQIIDANVLDLFAGTGSYGLEALSRGAKEVTFIENSQEAILSLEKNKLAVAKSMHANPNHLKLIKTDVIKFLQKNEEKFDLIFADPPYDIIEELIPNLIQLIPKSLNPQALFIIEVPNYLEGKEFSGLNYLKKIGKGSRNSPTARVYIITQP